MIAFKHRSPAQLGMALYRRFLFLLVSMPSYISVIEFALESSTYRTARRPFRSNLRLARLPSDSFARIFDLPDSPATLLLESSTCRTPQRLFRLRSCGFQSLGVPLPCPLGVPALAEGQGPTHGLRSHWFRLFTKGKEGCTASTPTGSGSL